MFTIKWSVAFIPFLSAWFGGQEPNLSQNSNDVSAKGPVVIQTCKPYPECEIEKLESQSL